MNDNMALVATTTLGSTGRWGLDKEKLRVYEIGFFAAVQHFDTPGGVLSSVLSCEH
jgi:hypothetical protein